LLCQSKISLCLQHLKIMYHWRYDAEFYMHMTKLFFPFSIRFILLSRSCHTGMNTMVPPHRILYLAEEGCTLGAEECLHVSASHLFYTSTGDPGSHLLSSVYYQ
jgi:hypothetical protein